MKEFWEAIHVMNDVYEITDVNLTVSTKDMRGPGDVLRKAEVELVLKNL